MACWRRGSSAARLSGDYWGYANYWEDAIYIGLLPLLLAIGALLGSLRRKQGAEQMGRHLTWFLGGLIVLSLLLALGKNTPVFPWLYRHIPTFAMFQAPARWLIWSEFALALLAGMGVERWRQPQGWGLYWTRMWTMGAFAITLGAGLAWLYLGAISPSFIRATALMGFFGVGIGVLSQTAPPRREQAHARQQDALHLMVGVGAGHRREERLGVRVTRRGVRLLGRRQFHDAAQIHHGDPVADVLRDREIMRDEQVSKPEDPFADRLEG